MSRIQLLLWFVCARAAINAGVPTGQGERTAAALLLSPHSRSILEVPRECDGTRDPLKESLGCLRGWVGEATPPRGIRDLAAARSYGGEIIVLEVFHVHRGGKSGGLLEDLAAFLENLRALRLDHYVVVAESRDTCDAATAKLREARVLGQEEVLSCTWLDMAVILPGVEWDTICQYGPFGASAEKQDHICLEMLRWLLARELKQAGLNVLVVDLDVSLAQNPYVALHAPDLRRHTGLVMQMPYNCGVMYFGGCDGAKVGTGAWLLNEIHRLLSVWLQPHTPGIQEGTRGRLGGSEAPGWVLRVPHEEGPHTTNGILINLWDQKLIEDLLREAADGKQPFCHIRHKDPDQPDQEWQEVRKYCGERVNLWDPNNKAEYPDQGPGPTLIPAWKEMTVRLASGGQVFGAYGAVNRQRVEGLAGRKGQGRGMYEAKVGDVCADGSRDTVMEAPAWLMTEGKLGTPSIFNHWVTMNAGSYCTRRLAAKVSGWYNGGAYVPGVTLPPDPSLLVLGEGWRLPESSFGAWLREVRTFIQIARMLGRRAVLPSVPCDAFGDGAASRWPPYRLREGDFDLKCTHGYTPLGPLIPGSREGGDGELQRNRMIVGCSTGAEDEARCELATPCGCQMGTDAMIAYGADLQALLQNVDGRFGNVTTAHVTLQVESRHSSVTAKEAVKMLKGGPHKRVNVLYLDAFHDRQGFPLFSDISKMDAEDCVGSVDFQTGGRMRR